MDEHKQTKKGGWQKEESISRDKCNKSKMYNCGGKTKGCNDHA